MKWIVTYYTRQKTVISSYTVEDMTEEEAEVEALSDMPDDCKDWEVTEG